MFTKKWQASMRRHVFKTPGLALKVEHSLNRCAKILKGIQFLCTSGRRCC